MGYRKTKPEPIDHLRIRKIRGSLNQIEDRLINDRFIDCMQKEEILLYFFLVAVGDAKRVSFYTSERMASILKIEVTSIEEARQGLLRKGFLAYRDGIYQVLDLPSGWVEQRSQEWISSSGVR